MSMAGVLHGGGRPGGSGRPDRLALLFCLLHIAGSPSMARDSCKEQGGSRGSSPARYVVRRVMSRKIQRLRVAELTFSELCGKAFKTHLLGKAC